MSTRLLLVGLVAVSVLLAAGCATPRPAPVRSPAAPSPTPSADPGAAAEQDALAAYRGMWNAFVEAAKTSDADAPQLRRYASDDALKLIVNALYTNHERGKVILGQLRIDPRITAVTPPEAPTEASVVDCVDDEDWLEYKTSGGLFNDTPGGRHPTTATVRLGSEGWQVTRFVVQGDSSC